MNAHLGDFGIASLVVGSRSIAVGQSSSSGYSSSLAMTGTIGYIAPGTDKKCCHTLLYICLYKSNLNYFFLMFL
jgi:hypothetical protein